MDHGRAQNYWDIAEECDKVRNVSEVVKKSVHYTMSLVAGHDANELHSALLEKELHVAMTESWLCVARVYFYFTLRLIS